MTYEQQLQQLESLIKQLENGELSLEKALAAYEEGIKLIRSCQQQLEHAEQRIQQLSRDANGQETLRPFSDENPTDTRDGNLPNTVE
ncbi:MAG: exodeoxyribonuclease VII small subunit [Cardiobacteriaceae bacterium]|nr:exodeoxyribonuclease VII small subunit [Cardiobacteriaceae bacterium]